MTADSSTDRGDGAGQPPVTAPHVLLGVGDIVTVRRPTTEEQAHHHLGPNVSIVIVYRPDRDAEVMSADGVTIAPRSYGLVPR
jgi:hypothetical protein